MSASQAKPEEKKQTEAEKLEEQKRRLKEQSKWSDAEQWFSAYYAENRKLSRLFWERVEDEMVSDAEKADMKDRQATNAQAYIGQKKESTYRITDGLFRATVDSQYHSRETSRNFFIELKDGAARPRPPLRESEFASHQKLYMQKFNAVYGQIMDFMAVQCGYSSLEIDLPDLSPLMSQYDYMRMNALMDLAKERGLQISYGPKIMEWLRDKPNDHVRYMNLLEDVNNHAKAGTKTDQLHQYEYQLATRRFGELERPTEADYKTKLNEATAEGENIAKLDAFDKSVSEVATRLGDLQRSVSALSSHIDEYAKDVDKAQSEDDLVTIEHYIEKAEKQRGKLMDAIKVERDHLQVRHAALVEKNVEIAALPIDKSADGKPLKEEAKAAEEARRDATKGRLEKMEKEGLAKLSNEALNKVQVDKVSALKTKVEERKKAIQASKPGGP